MSTPAVQVDSTGQGSQQTWHTVARVVFPAGQDEDIIPLYLTFGRSAGVPPEEQEISGRPERGGPVTERAPVAVFSGTEHSEAILSRRSIRVASGERASLATYFNAFPASYWRKWTNVDTVRLALTIEGAASVLVYKSNPRGVAQRAKTVRTDGTRTDLVFDLPLTAFGDGGWYWFDIVSRDGDVILHEAQWQVPVAPVRPGTFSIGVTTLNRTDYVARLVSALAEADDLRGHLDRLYIVDQGSTPVESDPAWPAAAAAMGEQLQLIHQDNLGGSGGFSRGMYETVTAGTSTYHLLLDDDIMVEPEGILRAVAFASHCRRATIVGGHMFDLMNRSVLHAMGEEIDEWKWFWGPVRGLPQGHNLANKGLRETGWMHRRIDVGYNGWWMSLIPVEIIKEIGLSLPVFIKWDDAEYSVRAREHGFPTVSLPGACVWHVSWADKDDSVDWQAYFHERNRLISALLHSPYPHGGRVLTEGTAADVKHGFSMQYYAQELRVRALRDVLAGPGGLHASLRTALTEARALAPQFPDARYQADPEAFPPVHRRKPLRKGKFPTAPHIALLPLWAAATLTKHLMPVDEEALASPQVTVPHSLSKWWFLSQFDSAVVSKADGTGAAFYQRDPAKLRELLTTSLTLRARLRTHWAALSTQYRQELAHITSIEEWERTFFHRSTPSG